MTKQVEKPIIYEPHPVSPERKKELRQAGYIILDAKFDPQGAPTQASSETGDDSSLGTTGKVTPDTSGMTAEDLRAELANASVQFDSRIGKEKLSALYVAFVRTGMTGSEWNNLADSDKAERIAVAKEP